MSAPEEIMAKAKQYQPDQPEQPAPDAAGDAPPPRRDPRPGDLVYFYKLNPAKGPHALEARVVQPAPGAGCLHLNVFELGLMTPVLNVPFAPEPRVGCWGWPESRGD
jgi:hypothetical protein